MRFAGLLLCVVAAGCAGGPSGPESVFTTSAPVSAPVEDEPARSAANTRTAAAAQSPVSEQERQTQARADCWMKVERDRANARNIDRRAAAVDKCVADAMKRPH